MHPPRGNPNIFQVRSRRTPRSAFSLIELILVMTIISILAAIAVPRYSNAQSRYRADAIARRIVMDLDYASEFARSKSTSVTFQFSPAQDRIRINGARSLDNPSNNWEVYIDQQPYYADLVSTDFSSNALTIDGYGYPDQSGTIKISVSGETRSIYMDADTGKAEVQ